jgi:proteasome lid subunit RPN8/RPN11
MLGIQVVHNCPYTQSGQGVMHISHRVLAIMAGAVQDDDEWMAFLIGKRRTDGLEIHVTDLRVPEQYRDHGSCETVKVEPLPEDVVGVVHSHHTMGAFFSNTDVTKLNPRFPTSIVIAQLKQGSTAEEKLLGFNYKAEGRAPLPCKSIGVVDFTVQPDPMVPEWPVQVQAKYEAPADTTLHYCPNKTRSLTSLSEVCISSCGITRTAPVIGYFGENSKAFMADVVKKTKVDPTYKGGYGKGYVVTDQRGNKWARREPAGFDFTGPWNDDDNLRHWSDSRSYR